jgi:D-threonate/D-erythronate kinase
MIMKMLIVADDLSGAADCAAGCVQSGLRTVVQLGLEADTDGFDVVAFDADSRRLPASDAATVHFTLLQRLTQQRPAILYKKIDSTLRGSFAEELFATAELTGIPILAPSFPAMGRTMVNGQLLVNGVPLEQTEVWKNEKRCGPSTLPAMLDAAGFQSVVIDLDIVRGDLEVFRSILEKEICVEKRAIVCDAETENDLACIAQATVSLTRRCLLVGSAGLMRHLPKAHGLSGSVGLSHERKRNQFLPVLTVVGSIASASRQQCRHVAKTAKTVVYTIDPQVLREGSTHSQWLECRQYVLDSLARKEDTVVTIGGESPDLSEGPLLAAALAWLVHPALDLVGGLILTGGETARALLSGWGVQALELIGELEAGVPLSCISDHRFVPVITKAGAFGSEDCLSQAFQLLKSDF